MEISNQEFVRELVKVSLHGTLTVFSPIFCLVPPLLSCTPLHISYFKFLLSSVSQQLQKREK